MGIVQRVQRAKVVGYLPEERHGLYSAAFQEALAARLDADHPTGPPPSAPAHRAVATRRQAETGVADAEGLEATTRERRGQRVRDGLDGRAPPFSTATVVAFRPRPRDGDRRLVARTLEVAKESGRFSPKAGRAALESRPLWGAGRGEDPSNVLGPALRQAVSGRARQQGRGRAQLAGADGGGSGGGTGRRPPEPQRGLGPGRSGGPNPGGCSPSWAPGMP